MLAPPRQPDILLAESEDGYGFAVTVVPPPTGPGHDRDFSGYIDARTYARGLRWANGWKLVDRVDARTRKAAEETERLRVEARRSGLSVRG
jgi:hypothetical protein